MATVAPGPTKGETMNESIQAGIERGYEMFFRGCGYECPALKLYGYARDTELRAAIRRTLKNKARRERDQVRRDMGLVRVRGALGGVYWE